MTETSSDNSDYSHVALVGVDFFSLSHMACGMLIFSLLNLIPSLDKWWAWLITVIIGIIWEPIENNFLDKWQDRRDSALNITCDIIFIGWGALVSLYMENFLRALIVNMILFIIWGILYYIAIQEVEKKNANKNS